jgi:hypothetical protein
VGVSSSEAALELVGLGFLISHANYLAFLEASVTVLGGPIIIGLDPDKTS